MALSRSHPWHGWRIRVGRGAPEVAAHDHGRIDLPSFGGLQARHGSKPLSRESVMPKDFSMAVKTCSETMGLTPIVPMPWTLEWPRSGSRPRAATHHAAQQRQIGDGLDIGDAVQMCVIPCPRRKDHVPPLGIAARQRSISACGMPAEF